MAVRLAGRMRMPPDWFRPNSIRALTMSVTSTLYARWATRIDRLRSTSRPRPPRCERTTARRESS
jgi:hypothetical protein